MSIFTSNVYGILTGNFQVQSPSFIDVRGSHDLLCLVHKWKQSWFSFYTHAWGLLEWYDINAMAGCEEGVGCLACISQLKYVCLSPDGKDKKQVWAMFYKYINFHSLTIFNLKYQRKTSLVILGKLLQIQWNSSIMVLPY